jgi:GTP-binding protein Era
MNQSVTTTLSDVDAIVHVVEASHWVAGDDQIAALLASGVPVVLALNKVDRVRDRVKLGMLLQRRAQPAITPH